MDYYFHILIIQHLLNSLQIVGYFFLHMQLYLSQKNAHSLTMA